MTNKTILDTKTTLCIVCKLFYLQKNLTCSHLLQLYIHSIKSLSTVTLVSKSISCNKASGTTLIWPGICYISISNSNIKSNHWACLLLNVVRTAANANWHDQSSKQTGNQASNNAIFPMQSTMLRNPTLLHCSYTLLCCGYTQLLISILIYT